jgi:hypothetical protein
MITRHTVSVWLLAYLNHDLTLAQLVDSAENCFVTGGFYPDEDIELLRDIVSYLAAADTTAFPLTWEICVDFMQRLGTPIKAVILEAS